MNAADVLRNVAGRVKEQFEKDRTVLPFDDYLALVLEDPRAHLRGAASYVLDAVEGAGAYEVVRPYGTFTRWKMFDQLQDATDIRVAGQESVQQELVRHLRGFSRTGRADRLLLLHGPNGSAKSSIMSCLIQAVEQFSRTPPGALYRFSWVFPTSKVQKGSLGFVQDKGGGALGSYALLDSKDLDARISCTVKDHPLLLLPRQDRMDFIKSLKESGALPKDYQVPFILLKGDLSPKNRTIFDAVLNAHSGDLAEVLRHVQVERLYISKRYRNGAVSLEPQMSVDGWSRPITADRNYANLPVSLQGLVLFDAGGAVVEANRGVLEFNDLLKRPVEAFKYLLSATETQTAALEFITVFLDMVMVATSNETHLDAFKAYPDWQSFKGRMELVKAPYLVRFSDEVQVYKDLLKRAALQRPVAPHALDVAARFAVLTRLEPPDPSQYPTAIRDVVAELKPADKLRLYEDGATPERLTSPQARELRRIIPDLFRERESSPDYEGRHGASAREIRGVLLAAATHPQYRALTPQAVIAELRSLVKETTVYEWLGRDRKRGYRDASAFVDEVEQWHLEQLDEEVRTAMGLVEDQSTLDLFDRYIKHIIAWVRKETVLDPLTRTVREPDKELMKQMEEVLLPKGEDEGAFRKSLISTIGARSLEQKADERVDLKEIFSTQLRKLKDDFYEKRHRQVRRIAQNFLKWHAGETRDLDTRDRDAVEGMLGRLKDQFGYTDESAPDAVAYLVKRRYVE
jgi:serine protein kinase